MRIAILSTMGAAPWGGSEELWAATARRAVEQGHQVDAYLWGVKRSRPQARELSARGVRIQQYPAPDSAFQKYKQRVLTRHPSLGRWLGRWLLSFDALIRSKPDVVLLSLGDTYVLGLHREYQWLLRELHARGIPSVIVVQLSVDHWTPDAAAAQVTRDAFAQAHRVGFVSEHNLRLVERQLNAPLPNGVVVRNPVNLSDQSPVPWPAGEVATFAMPARLDIAHKGHDIMLDVLATAPWRAREWTLRLYGAGPDVAEIRRRVALAGLSGRVEFCGHVADVRSIWAANQVLLMPSRMEGTPLSMVEAMLCARPGVYSSAGGIPEWIREGEDGFIAKNATADSIGQALERAWMQRDHWHDIGLRAHDRAKQLIDPDPGATLLAMLIEAAKCGGH